MNVPTLEAPQRALERLRRALKSRALREVDALLALDGGVSEQIGSHPLLERALPDTRSSFLRVVAQLDAQATSEQLAEAWADVDSEIVAVHPRSPTEAEIIERVRAPGEAPFTLSTTMDASSGAWRVLTTRPALEDRLLVWIPRPLPPEGPRLSSRDFERDLSSNWKEESTLSLRADGTLSVITSQGEVRGWIAPPVEALRARVPSLAPHKSILALELDLPDDIDERLERMGVLAAVVWTFLRQLAHGVVLPEQGRFMEVWTFAELVAPAMTSVVDLAKIWVALVKREDRLCSSGMRYFRLPELEIPAAAREAESTLWRTMEYLLEQGPVLHVGDTLGPPEAPTHRVHAGSIGPVPGVSHGAAGSLFLEPIAPSAKRQG